jgi:LysM repeat protein
MSLISFLKDAGERLFNTGPAGGAAKPAAAPAAAGSPAAAAPAQPQQSVAELNRIAGEEIKKYVLSQNLSAENLEVRYDGATQTVTVSGVAPDQATKEKIVLCCGNVQAVEHVDDRLTVAKAAEPPAKFYTVKKGDTLSKIAAEFYGKGGAYMKIFEANQPMLKDPDKIYPGQTLRIPPAG